MRSRTFLQRVCSLDAIGSARYTPRPSSVRYSTGLLLCADSLDALTDTSAIASQKSAQPRANNTTAPSVLMVQNGTRSPAKHQRQCQRLARGTVCSSRKTTTLQHKQQCRSLFQGITSDFLISITDMFDLMRVRFDRSGRGLFVIHENRRSRASLLQLSCSLSNRIHQALLSLRI